MEELKNAKYWNSIDDAFLNRIVAAMLNEPSDNKCFKESNLMKTTLELLKFRFEAMIEVYESNENLKNNDMFKDAKKHLNKLFTELTTAEEKASELDGTSKNLK